MGDTAKAARICLEAPRRGRAGLTAEALTRIADLAAALWLAGDPPPPETSLAKVHDAAEKRWPRGPAEQAAEEVDALLNAIPLRSPFKPLRLVIKSLTGAEDSERRLRLLDMVPPVGFRVARQCHPPRGVRRHLAHPRRVGRPQDVARTFVTEPADARPTGPSF